MKLPNVWAWILAGSVVPIATAAGIDWKDAGKIDPRLTTVPRRLIVKPRDPAEFRGLLESGLGQMGEETLSVQKIGTTGYYAVDRQGKETAVVFSPFFRKSGRFESIQTDP